jgi:hypothetical protein
MIYSRKVGKAEMCAALFFLLVAPHRVVPQATQPVSSGPTLEVTMKFIGDFLTSQSPVEWSHTSPDGDGDPITIAMSAEYRNFSHTGCLLQYEYQLSYYSSPWHVVSIDFTKADVLRMRVEAESAIEDREIAAAGANFTVKISPEVYRVYGFYLSDQAQAERILKALTHAAALCGSAADQPF